MKAKDRMTELKTALAHAKEKKREAVAQKDTISKGMLTTCTHLEDKMVEIIVGHCLGGFIYDLRRPKDSI